MQVILLHQCDGCKAAKSEDQEQHKIHQRAADIFSRTVLAQLEPLPVFSNQHVVGSAAWLEEAHQHQVGIDKAKEKLSRAKNKIYLEAFKARFSW